MLGIKLNEIKGKYLSNFQVASVIAIAASLITKLLGMVREMKVTAALGASIESDAYNVAYMLVVTLFGLFSSAYSNSLTPTAAKLYNSDRNKLNRTVDSILSISIFAMLIIIGLVYLFPNLFVKLFASQLNEETTELAASLIKISIWSLVILVVCSALTIVVRIHGHNLFPSIVDIAFPLPILIALFAGATSPYILILCIVLGYLLKTILLAVESCRIGYMFKPTVNFHDTDIVPFFKMMPPMLLGSGLLQINVIFDNQVVSGFGVGSVTAVSLASKVNSLVYTVFSTSLMQIVFAELSKAYLSGNKNRFQKLVRDQTGLILKFVIPCFLIVHIFSLEIIQILFVRGNFTMENAYIASDVLKGYSLGLIFYVIRDICTYMYYSSKNSKLPAMVTGFSALANIILNIILSSFMGVKGVAYATSVTAFFSMSVLLFFLKKRVADVTLVAFYDIVKYIIISFIDIILLLYLRNLLSSFNVLTNFVAFALGIIVFWTLDFAADFIIKKKNA